MINGSGTFDALAAQRAFGPALARDFPFAAYVSKTITLQPRAGNPAPRLWEAPGGLINSIGLPNKGLDGYMAEDLPALHELLAAAGGEGVQTPPPLITNVMGSSEQELRGARRRLRRARRDRRDRAQRVLPERQDRPGHRRRPGAACSRSSAPAAPTPPSR